MAQASAINCLTNARVQDPRARRGLDARKAFSGVQVPNARRRVQLAARSLTMRTTASVDMKSVIEKLCEKEDLSMAESTETLESLLTGADAAQISAFLVLLRTKGETAEEIAGLAKAMRNSAVSCDCGPGVLDIVGTGGDGIGSVNISTGSCLLAAAAGAKVAKHGNRSVSSMCGSADVLEALGVVADLGPEGVQACVKETNMGFMFAPRYHPAMKAVVPVRKSLGVRTAFNILGPMLNPANAEYGLVGVYSPSIIPLMANSLRLLGMKKALVVHSMGLDELVPMGPATIAELTDGKVEQYEFDPLEVGIKRCTVEDLKGGDRFLNAEILRDTLSGTPGPVADALALNAGVALHACGVAPNSVAEGVTMALEVHRSGAGLKTLDAWVAKSQEMSEKEKK
mmetsp:Transcript_19888/g.43507  ORF Transcript_19888/g.43507 Transcript_19888/m.43507 type:complete len:399 (-) Transcript_19888:387-1583(-)|eukprot:CAMPEP_0118932090 /NCGR_PEP_ID=MMETSP1169-20130426/9073_1 /TAXON_ID=36882 /ORGANISM="Pyramimonas obovata, Strain CCMP722" /LENGTH=398 /DNA_ID=CAMNT_0006874693 /DNA_START=208 /DNA_END=1404 /DNA_ORIENTATION=+